MIRNSGLLFGQPCIAYAFDIYGKKTTYWKNCWGQ